ncbi:MAG: hypothetical protein ABDH63_06865 [Candidatus Caldarchaeales archaeon]
MASASVIVEGIALVAAVIAASSLASAVLSNLSAIEGVQRDLLAELRERAATRLVVMAVIYDDTDHEIRVYLKNVGRRSIPASELTGATVMLTSVNRAEVFLHERSGRRGTWTLEGPTAELVRGGNAELTVRPKSPLQTGEYLLTLVLANGVSAEARFSVG